ncbi:helix-turn-helix domain-containing protein [Curtobacterium sp. MCLR17_007]|uniref:AraC family transcriptional regulator n=1 Tax=Curtobacterium sp. MCLR17_007 TaxID=2175648 RepID=UPI000DAA9C0A|nr:helix-turn-helix domain-containing protein [Curtobacterium sp. MCLR17_007]WIB60894.1 helix-turn-helix domain-containing protein [Curtobacterium sp. MCLR17_007]
MTGAHEMFTAHRVAASTTVDEAAAALSAVFLPVQISRSEPAPGLRMQLNALAAGRITFGYMRFREAVRLRTAEPVNYHLDIQVRSEMTMRAARGTRYRGTEQTAGVFMPGRSVELDCSNWFAQVAVMIPHRDLQTELELLLDAPISTPPEFETEFDLSTDGGRAVSRAIRLVDDASRGTLGLLEHPLAVHSLEQVFLHSLLLGQPHNHSAALDMPTGGSGARSVSLAVELLRTDPARPWTVGELASAVSTSVRSLQEGFRRTLDTTPTAYLRRLRLERAREELVTARAGSVTVSEVAGRWGFLHVSRFASAYAERFGELPSATLGWTSSSSRPGQPAGGPGPRVSPRGGGGAR